MTNLQQTLHISPSWASYGVSVVRIWKEIYHVVMALHCISNALEIRLRLNHWFVIYSRFRRPLKKRVKWRRLQWTRSLMMVWPQTLMKVNSIQQRTIGTQLLQEFSFSEVPTQITRFVWPTWGHLGPVGPMLAPWILLSGYLYPKTHLCTHWKSKCKI